jgi:hypothetical protein
LARNGDPPPPKVREADFTPVDQGRTIFAMTDPSHYRVNEQRPLTTDERQLLEWLIAHGFPTAAKYESQLTQVVVVSRCTCGCPTVDFAVAGKQTFGASEIIAEAEGKSPEGVAVGVIVHAREGQLSELEIYSIEPHAAPFGLPRPDALVALSTNS